MSQSSPGSNHSHLSKYKVFSLKALWQSIVLLQTENNSHRQQILLELTEQCCSLLMNCQDVPGEFPPHTTNSLLLNLANVCWKIGKVDECIKACQTLHSKLSPRTLTSGGDSTGTLRQVFVFLWRDVATQLDKQGRSSEFVLSVRESALRSYLASESSNVVKALDYTMKAERFFTKLTTFPTESNHISVLYPFHTSVFPHASLPEIMSLDSTSANVVPVAQYLLHRAMLSVRAGQASEGEELVKRAVSYTQRHAGSLPVAVQASAVQLWMFIYTSDSDR